MDWARGLAYLRTPGADGLLDTKASTEDGPKRITIIGAGIAGLVAAYELNSSETTSKSWKEVEGSVAGSTRTASVYPPVEGDPASGAALLASYTIGDDARARLHAH